MWVAVVILQKSTRGRENKGTYVRYTIPQIRWGNIHLWVCSDSLLNCCLWNTPTREHRSFDYNYIYRSSLGFDCNQVIWLLFSSELFHSSDFTVFLHLQRLSCTICLFDRSPSHIWLPNNFSIKKDEMKCTCLWLCTQMPCVQLHKYVFCFLGATNKENTRIQSPYLNNCPFARACTPIQIHVWSILTEPRSTTCTHVQPLPLLSCSTPGSRCLGTAYSLSEFLCTQQTAALSTSGCSGKFALGGDGVEVGGFELVEGIRKSEKEGAHRGETLTRLCAALEKNLQRMCVGMLQERCSGTGCLCHIMQLEKTQGGFAAYLCHLWPLLSASAFWML